MTCGIYSVNWVTTSNNRLPHNPCLFCDSCFKSYNYIKGKKIGSFKAYPYPFDSDLLEPNINLLTKPKRDCKNTSINESQTKMMQSQEFIDPEVLQNENS
jgi:hypothetical protein